VSGCAAVRVQRVRPAQTEWQMHGQQGYVWKEVYHDYLVGGVGVWTVNAIEVENSLVG